MRRSPAALAARDGVRVVAVGGHVELGLVELRPVRVTDGGHFVQRLSGGVDRGDLQRRPGQVDAVGLGLSDLGGDRVVDLDEPAVEAADRDVATALCLGECRRDVLEIGGDLGHLLSTEPQPLGRASDLLGIVDRMCGVVAIPGLLEALLGLKKLFVGLGDARASGTKRAGQLADLAGCARLDRVVDLPRIASGRADEFGNTPIGPAGDS